MPDDDFKFIDPFEMTPSTTGHQWLRRDGVYLPAPREVQRGQLRGCLWELIYALAARRIFLTSTDHLSDLELYAWLYNEWLPKEIETPGRTESNKTVSLIGTGSESDNQIWLRHYADEDLRRRWVEDFPADPVPPHEPAPYDRDRWLPVASAVAGAIESEDEADPFTTDEPQAPPDELHDPLQLELVDREIHLEQPLFDTPDGEGDEYCAEDNESSEGSSTEPAIGIEQENWKKPHDELARAGVSLPPPDEMTDEWIPAKLWELLHELACRGFYLLHTNHLTDRELYAKLWRENLREPAILPGPSASGGWYHDFVGSGSAADTQLWLRYYATDRERETHARDNPGEPLPPRAEGPSRRDNRIPHGPF
jgi:hypothetical protein